MNLSILSEQIASQDIFEWIGLITGVIYIILAAYERPSCWIFGIISSAAIAWKSFTEYMLVADGVLQLFYIAIGFVGLLNWFQGRVGDQQKPIVTSPLKIHLLVIAGCLLLSIPLSLLLIKFANARYGYVDTAITLLSVWATVLLVKKDLHNWIYWIVLDAALVWLYFASEGYLFAVLFLIYTVIAVWGYKQWQRNVFKKEKF